MENNYHFKINQMPPSDEQIAQHMDFDALLQKHQTRQLTPEREPVVRRLIYWGGAVAATIAFLLYFFSLRSPVQEAINPEGYFAQKSAITPPLPLENNQTYKTFSSTTINANQGGIYEYESGSRLVVPASAFMDDRGHLIEGDITIYYREYINSADFFLSGIPLNYDDNSENYLLESSGMVEVFAYQNGKLLTLVADKSIQVELVGHMVVPYDANTPAYNVYQFDSLERKWNYSQVDNIQFIEDVNVQKDNPIYQLYSTHQTNLNAINAKEETAIAAIDNSIPMPTQPIKPQPRDKNRPTLELSFLKDVFNKKGVDKNLYMETIWQIAENSPAYDERAFQVVWEDANIRNINGSDYELTLSSGSNSVRLIVNPVLSSNEFSQALSIYQSNLANYKQQLKEREATLIEQKRALESLYQKEREKEDNKYKRQLASIASDGGAPSFLLRKIMNRFETNKLGVFACATPHPVQERSFSANFSYEGEETFVPQIAFIHVKNSNIVQRILAQNGTPIHYASRSTIEIWMIDKAGNLFTSEIFSPGNTTKSHTFVLKNNGVVSNREEVGRFLQEL